MANLILGAGGAAADAYTIDQSLRFNAADDPYLSRTFDSGDRKTWTVSTWIKLALVDTTDHGEIFNGYTGDSDAEFTAIYLYNGLLRVAGWSTRWRETTQEFRDPGAWYHLVVAFDTTESAADDRCKIFINGSQVTSFVNNNTLTENGDYGINSDGVHHIGRDNAASSDRNLSGYLAEFYFIDGTAYDADDFGETDSTTNQWKPIDASGLTFGTTGFYQKYGDPYGTEAFTSTGSHTWTCPVGVTEVEVLIVGGGGGGGSYYHGAGGGAGGVVHDNDYTVVPGTVYDITVGAKGGKGSGNAMGSDGADSVFNVNAEGSGLALTAKGGGGGANESNSTAATGGSGGGGTYNSAGAASNQGTFTGATSYGNAGGTGTNSTYNTTGAGGGADAAGTGGTDSRSGDGGDGHLFSNFTSYGVSGYFAGGGGGSVSSGSGTGGNGGAGGGGAGSYSNGGDATASTGSGGGGGERGGSTGGDGADGVVLIRIDSGLGADSSGNNNTFTVTNLVASDKMVDSPTNNFATFNPLVKPNGTLTYSEGNLKTVAGSNWNGAVSTIGSASGKWYMEFRAGSTSSLIGVIGASNAQWWDGDGNPQDDTTGTVLYYGYSGDKRINNVDATYGDSYTDGDIIGIALNLDDSEITFYKNGTVQDSGTAISFPANLISQSLYAFAFSTNASTSYANFGQDSSFAGTETAQGNADGNEVGDFFYEPPASYLALCSSNLPTPEIKLPGDHFNTVLWSGDDANPRTVSGVGFQADMTWQRRRNGAADWRQYDSVRAGSYSPGTSNPVLTSNNDSSEWTVTTTGTLSAWTADGFTLSGSSSTTDINNSAGTYASWNWLAGGTPTATNTATTGVMTSGSVFQDGVSNTSFTPGSSVYPDKISANTTNGFSIIEYTGTGSNLTVAHGLSQAPEMVIVKDLEDSAPWSVGTSYSDDWTDYLILNTNAGVEDDSGWWQDTAPTASLISIGAMGPVNVDDHSFIIFAYHSVEGYSKVGSYEGNNDATDGTFVYCGFKPAMLITKSTSAGQDWTIRDNTRSPYNVSAALLEPNDSVAEVTDSWTYIDFVSNGFKLRNNNTQGGNYGKQLFIAFAESPFKYSPAR